MFRQFGDAKKVHLVFEPALARRGDRVTNFIYGFIDEKTEVEKKTDKSSEKLASGDKIEKDKKLDDKDEKEEKKDDKGLKFGI